MVFKIGRQIQKCNAKARFGLDDASESSGNPLGPYLVIVCSNVRDLVLLDELCPKPGYRH